MSQLAELQRLEMMKRATSAPDTNEDRKDPSMSEVRDPAVDAPMNKTPPDANTLAVLEAQRETREGVLENVLGDLSEKEQPDQKLLAANFDHFSSGDFFTRSPLLTSKMKGPRAETLRDQIGRVLGKE